MYRRLCQAMDRPELADDERYATHNARGENAAELDAVIAEWTRTMTADELNAVLDRHAVVVGPIYSIADIAEDPQYRARGMLRRVQDEVFGDIAVPGIVPRLSETEGDIAWLGSPEPGSHNQEVYGGILGLGDDELMELENDGII